MRQRRLPKPGAEIFLPLGVRAPDGQDNTAKGSLPGRVVDRSAQSRDYRR